MFDVTRSRPAAAEPGDPQPSSVGGVLGAIGGEATPDVTTVPDVGAVDGLVGAAEPEEVPPACEAAGAFPTVIVIGAGVSGCACAAALASSRPAHHRHEQRDG